MNFASTTLFAQLINLAPRDLLEKASEGLYKAGNAAKFTVWDQFVALVFCHIGGADSLREIEDGLYSALGNLQHAGGAKALKRTSLAYANSVRDYHIFERFYKALVKRFSEEFSIKFGKRFNKPTYAIDSTTISVCMKLFPWAKYKSTKGGFKLHTALDLETGLPAVMNMTEARLHDSKAVRKIIRSLPPFSVVVMDRGYNDYELFGDLTDSGVTFVTRLKENAQTSKLTVKAQKPDAWGVYEFTFSSEAAKKRCGDTKFHLIQWYDEESNRWFDFLTNDLSLDAPTVANLYKERWKIELFFKKIKQNLKVKSFVGTNENAVMSQIWTAAIVTLLMELLRLRSSFPWHFSRLFKFIRLNLLTFKNLLEWINRPDISQKDLKSGPLRPRDAYQLSLPLTAD